MHYLTTILLVVRPKMAHRMFSSTRTAAVLAPGYESGNTEGHSRSA
jgi:hypothetical protein